MNQNFIIKIALLQIAPCKTLKENLEKVIRYCRKARENGAELDLEQLRNYRKNEVHGNAYRHPGKYELLIEQKIDKPFIRKDYRT